MRSILISLKILIFFTILTGVIYPLLMTGIAQALFPWKANGSIIVKEGVRVGSELIGQDFDSAIFFSSRPSSISYNPLPSGGSNQSLTNAQLLRSFNERRVHFFELNNADSSTIVPSEMLFASSSGLDPHISPEAAMLQANRVASARHFNPVQKSSLIRLVEESVEKPQFLCLGERRVNVLLLNLKVQELE